MKALSYFDVNAETTLQTDASKKRTWSMFNPRREKSYVMLPGPSRRLSRITRI